MLVVRGNGVSSDSDATSFGTSPSVGPMSTGGRNAAATSTFEAIRCRGLGVAGLPGWGGPLPAEGDQRGGAAPGPAGGRHGPGAAGVEGRWAPHRAAGGQRPAGAQRARAGGPRRGGRREGQQGDRPGSWAEPRDGQDLRQRHPAEAGRAYAHRGRDSGGVPRRPAPDPDRAARREGIALAQVRGASSGRPGGPVAARFRGRLQADGPVARACSRPPPALAN